jgi:hypothetical protein
MEPPKNKDIWDKIPALSALLASMLVPIVLAVIGNAYTNALKQSENKVKYTELAISILRDKPTQETQDVRAWAIDVINQYSGVPMSAKAKNQLLGNQLARAYFPGSNFSQSNFSQSNFSQSNFQESLLDGASFKNAAFGRADLRGADLSHAIIDEYTKLPK